jgi:hypothetical protein
MNLEPLFRRSSDAARQAARQRWTEPGSRQAFADKRRGFHVPPERAEEYRHLRKYMSAAEAGRTMGLIP